MGSKEKAIRILSRAGVEVNGNKPWDIQVHDERFYNRVFGGGSLALGESYMDAWWDAEDLAAFLTKLLCVKLEEHIRPVSLLFHIARARLLNLQDKSRAFEVAVQHYDAGNDLYRRMLDKRMTYTCGYWKGTNTLDDAQEAKLDLVCKKIGLKKGDRVLDIGGGWGSFAGFAAEKYGAEVVAITISKEQARLGRELVKGLPVEIRVQDYRSVDDGPYDHIVSLGMFEHVGYKNYRTYMKKVRELLNPDGLFLLHTIGNNVSRFTGDPWINKYIFSNGMLPSIAQIGDAIERLFVVEDWHNFGPDYDRTLMEWFANFDKSWPEIHDNYNERFYRMWKYYLLTSAATFRARKTQLWQIVFSPEGIPGGYKSIR